MYPVNERFASPGHIVLAHANSCYAARSGRYLRRHGLLVHLASSGAEVRRLVRRVSPRVLVLDTGLCDESGWLICAKLAAEKRRLRVVLVTSEPSSETRALAEFVGASALVSREAGPRALVNLVLGRSLATAG